MVHESHEIKGTWGFYDTNNLTGLVHVPSGFEIRIGFLNTRPANPAKEWFWTQVEKRGGGLVPLGSDSPKQFDVMAKSWEKHLTRGNLMERLKKRLPKLDLAITNPNSFRKYNNLFFWEKVKRLGPHDPDGSYAELELEFAENPVHISWAPLEEETVLSKIQSRKHGKPFLIVLECFFAGEGREFEFSGGEGNPAIAFSRPPEAFFPCAEYPENISRVLTKTRTCASGKGKYHFFVFSPGTSLQYAASVDGKANLAPLFPEAGNILDNARTKYRNKCFSLDSESIFSGSAEACVRAIAWNTVYDFKKKRTFVPVSRRWAKMWGGWVLYPWDTFFAAMMVSRESPARGKDIVRTMLDHATDDGMLQNYTSPFQNTPDRSQPPVGSYVCLKTYFDDPDFLSEVYPALKKWHEWWLPNRDGNGDGLLEWGAGTKGKDPCRASLQGARYESGLDNSPMYDDVEFDEKSHCMKLADVGLNSLYALDAWSLSMIAGIIKNDADKEFHSSEYGLMKERINEKLWDEESGIYLNRRWNGRFSNRLSPTLFYPMIAGICPDERAKRMVKEHLLNKNEFWGEYVLPSISRNDPAFRDNNYWRGRIWGPMNFLVSEGLKRYGFYKESYELAERSARLFQKEWREESHVHENYNSINGEGDDVLNSEPVYTWGALLAFLSVQEILDYEPWAGIRIGSNFVKEDMELCNCRLGSDIYTVKIIDNAMEISTGFGRDISLERKAMFNNSRISRNTTMFCNL